MNRLQQILLAILVIQIIGAVIVFMPRSTNAQSDPLLTEYKADEVVKISIDDYEKNHADLIKDGSNWVYLLPSQDTFPLEADKAKKVLDQLGQAKNNRMVTRTVTSHKQLKVAEDDFVRKIILEMKDGKKTTIFVGTQPGGKTSHVRIDGQNEVYLIGLDSYDFGATANNWIDTTYVNIPGDTITSMSVKNAQGTFDFEKDSSGTWQMKSLSGKPFDVDKFLPLVNRMGTLRMTTPLSKKNIPDFKLDSPLAVITLNAKQGDAPQTSYLTVGAKDEKTNGYVAKYSASDYYVKVDGYFVDDFVKMKMEDYIKQPPTPTPSTNAP